MKFKETENERMDRLQKAMEVSWKNLTPFRKAAKELRDEYAGDKYGDRGSARAVYLNKVRQMVDIYCRQIVSGRPRVRVSAPDYPERRPFAEAFTVNLNRRLRELRLSGIFEGAFKAAMLGVGVVKTGLGQGDEEFEIDGEFYDIGKPFSEIITIDNFIIDTQAESIEQIDFIGDRFRMPKKWIYENFGLKENRDPLDSRRGGGKFNPEARTSGVNEEEEGSTLYEEGWVWEVYLPKEGLTLSWPQSMPEEFKVVEWEGPEGGPYEVMALERVPGEVMPVAPAGGIFHLHCFANRTMRKLSAQTGRQKVITAYEGDAEEDARAIVGAIDGQAIRVNNIDGVKQHAFGGPDPQIHNMAIWSLQQSELLAGNLSALGGLAPQSETFKQDAMLQEQASAVVEALRDKTYEFLERVIYKHAWFMWTEPIREMRTVRTEKINGFSVDIPYSFTPEEKEGDFLEYNFELDIYAMRKETPAEKAQKMISLLQQVIMPLGEHLMSSGYAPNATEIIREVSDLTGTPFDVLLTSVDPESMPKRPGEVQEPHSLQNSHRTYERVSRPGTTPAGNDKNLMQANLGANPQNSEAASSFSKAV